MTQLILMDDIFLRNFSYLKKKYALSRRALANLLHVSVYTVAAMEQNRWYDKVDTAIVLRLARIYNVDVDDLIAKDLRALECDKGICFEPQPQDIGLE